MKTKKIILASVTVAVAGLFSIPFLADLRRNARAADHAEAPSVAHDAGADIGDMYLFLDPNNDLDHTNVIMIMTLHGFIAPQENVNLGFFDPEVVHRFELEQTGDAKVDNVIDVTFAPRTSTATGQVATIQLPGKHKFTALTTPPSLNTNAPDPILTTNEDGVIFFAGVVDDPFFFDIPAFNRFVKSVLNGAPDTTFFNRARDSFAGYNNLAIALSVPADLIRPIAKGTNVIHVIGMDGRTLRRTEHLDKNGDIKSAGVLRSVDRMGVPAVNTALIPFAKKNAYNAATGEDDAKGKFAADILATLTALGTSSNYQAILAEVAVLHGDYLRLDLNIPNSGSGRGLPAGAVADAFPNGRRLHDDVIDILLTLINNGGDLGDNVDANDVPFRTIFPFLAPSQQPRENPVLGVTLTDDNTRN